MVGDFTYNQKLSDRDREFTFYISPELKPDLDKLGLGIINRTDGVVDLFYVHGKYREPLVRINNEYHKYELNQSELEKMYNKSELSMINNIIEKIKIYI